MLIDWDSLEPIELAPGLTQRQVELDNLFVALQEFTGSSGDKPMKTHAHPHRQAGFVLEGEIEVLVGTEIFLIQQGEAYLVPPDAVHGARVRKPTRLLNFYVAPGPDYIDEYRHKNSPRKDKQS